MSKAPEMKVLIVHFINHLPLGKSLETVSYLTQGQSLPDSVVSISYDGSQFLKLSHKVKRPSKENRDYVEYIPWQQVSKIIIED